MYARVLAPTPGHFSGLGLYGVWEHTQVSEQVRGTVDAGLVARTLWGGNAIRQLPKVAWSFHGQDSVSGFLLPDRALAIDHG